MCVLHYCTAAGCVRENPRLFSLRQPSRQTKTATHIMTGNEGRTRTCVCPAPYRVPGKNNNNMLFVLRDQTCLFHCIISLGQSQSHVSSVWHDYGVWFFSPGGKICSSRWHFFFWGEKVRSRTPFLCIFVLFCFCFLSMGGKSDPKLVFEPLLFNPSFCRCTEKNVCFFCLFCFCFFPLVSALFIVCLLLVHDWFWNKQSCHHPIPWIHHFKKND